MKLVKHILIIAITLSLTACAGEEVMDYGTVTKQLPVQSDLPQHTTGKSALKGAGVGTAAGAGLGVVASVATFGLATPLIPAFAAAGGAAGGAAGATKGHVTDQLNQRVLCDYIVKPDKTADEITVRQFAQNGISVGSRVKILQEKAGYKIVPLTK